MEFPNFFVIFSSFSKLNVINRRGKCDRKLAKAKAAVEPKTKLFNGHNFRAIFFSVFVCINFDDKIYFAFISSLSRAMCFSSSVATANTQKGAGWCIWRAHKVLHTTNCSLCNILKTRCDWLSQIMVETEKEKYFRRLWSGAWGLPPLTSHWFEWR